MALRNAVRAAGVAGGVGLAAVVGFAQSKDALPIPVIAPVPVVVPAGGQTTESAPVPSVEVPALPQLTPVQPPTPAPAAPSTPPTPPKKPAGPSSGTLRQSPAPVSSPDALPWMLAEARTAYAKVRDYVGHYVRQEQVSGLLVPEETCELRVRTNPFSVSVKVTAPKEYANRETAFVSTRYNGSKVRFKESNKLAYSTLRLDDPKVTADTRHAITDVGLAAVLDRVENAVRVEKRLGNPVQVLVTEYTFAGKPCTRYELFAERAHAYRYAYRHVLYIDKETHLPVRYEAYGQETPAGPTGGELIESQSFVGLKFNVGLGEQAFER